MSAFLRPDLQQFAAYSSHGDVSETTVPAVVDVLDTNESPYDLPAVLKEKLAFEYHRAIAANRYPDGGHEALKAAIAEYAIASAGLAPKAIQAEHVTVGNGSDELIRSLLIATCVGRPGAILVAEPTFSMYKILAETLGVEVVSVPRDSETFAVDLKSAQSAIEAARSPIRVVFMVSPNSPTGNAMTPAEIKWLQRLSTDCLVVVDEAYFEFCQQTTVVEAITRSNWIVTRTFSKAFRLAAHRVGYAIAHPDVIAVLEKVRLPYNLPSFSQTAALFALRHGDDILASIAETQSERDRVMRAMTELPNFQVWPSAANFVYARSTQEELGTVFRALYQQGTRIRQTGGGLRITIGTPEENTRTLEHLHRVLVSH